MFSELDKLRNFTETLIDISKKKTKKNKKKKKYIINIYGKLEEVEDEYEYDYDFEILRYPPDSNPPNPNNKLTLRSHFMIVNSTI